MHGGHSSALSRTTAQARAGLSQSMRQQTLSFEALNPVLLQLKAELLETIATTRAELSPVLAVTPPQLPVAAAAPWTGSRAAGARVSAVAEAPFALQCGPQPRPGGVRAPLGPPLVVSPVGSAKHDPPGTPPTLP